MFYRVSKNKENPYVIVNKNFINDESISWKAKGILLYLLSKPDDWRVYETDIVKHSTDGRDSVRSAIRELIKAGYIMREKVRNEKGRIVGSNYVVFEVPSKDGFSVNGESNNGKSNTTNNDLNNNDLNNYKNDNGDSLDSERTALLFPNSDIVNAIKAYMTNLYKQRKHRKHPYLKPEQYKRVYDSLDAFCKDTGIDYDGLITLMCAFLNSDITSDYNINHFATDGILLNRFYEELY